MTRISALFVLAIVRGGCSPVIMPTPLQLGETAPVLEKGDISLSGQAGFGSNFGSLGQVNDGWAAAGRARVGIGHDQEIGIEGMGGSESCSNTSASSNGSSNCQRPELNGEFGGAKVSWKLGLIPQLALIAGAGFGTSKTGSNVGGDLGAVLSTTGWLRPYLGARLGFSAPVTGNGQSGISWAVPAGLCVQVHHAVGLFAEVGAIGVPGGSSNSSASSQQVVVYLSGGVTVNLGELLSMNKDAR